MNDWKQLTESEGLHTFGWLEGRLYKISPLAPLLYWKLIYSFCFLFLVPCPFMASPILLLIFTYFLLKTALTPHWQRVTLYLESF